MRQQEVKGGDDDKEKEEMDRVEQHENAKRSRSFSDFPGNIHFSLRR